MGGGGSQGQEGGWRERQKAETRRVILEAAKELFDREGYEGATIRGVAARAGVGLGTVMSHFPDKTSLLSAALLEEWQATQFQAFASLPPGLPWNEQLMHLAGCFLDYYARRPSLSRVLLKEQLFNRQVWTDDLVEVENGALALGAQYLAQAQAEGHIRPGVDCLEASRVLFGLYQYVVFEGLSRPEPDPEAMKERLAGLVKVVMSGLEPA